MNEKKRVLQVRITTRLYDALVGRAGKNGVGVCDFVRQCLMKSVDNCPTCGSAAAATVSDEN